MKAKFVFGNHRDIESLVNAACEEIQKHYDVTDIKYETSIVGENILISALILWDIR